ncbi:MAG: pilus assembly protein [Bifidobacteriaceae bacterium]|nr:pilus assembly protein [Bifidobacteriaceae bacterium]
MVLPTVMVIAVVLLSLGRAVLVHVECQDAARAAAKEIAVSRTYSSAVSSRASIAAHTVSKKVSVRFSAGPESVVVTTQCPLLPGPLGIFPAQVQGKAAAMIQDS